MKCIASVLLVLALMASGFCIAVAETPTVDVNPGATFYFGLYEQDNNTENGAEPIEWIVLAVVEDKALLISRYALDCQPYHSDKADTSWEESEIRSWLNGGFLAESFAEEEQTAIISSTVSNADATCNGDWETTGGNDTTDMIFLLSYGEVHTYFTTKDDRKLTGTEFARERGAKFLGITSLGIDETDWWLRSPGKKQRDACYVDVLGSIGSEQVTGDMGIRPALWIDLSADQTFFPYTQYTLAVELAESGSYAEAAAIFEALGPYNNSHSLATENRYQQALIAEASGDYDVAIELFESLNGYSGSHEHGRACRYAQAVGYQEAGDYATAASLYGEIGQYEDSMIRMKTCFDNLGISVYYFTSTVVNAGVDTGYSKSHEIAGDDVHFGWQMGRFFMSGFTRVTDNETDNPIFIKTLGDSITLWFDIEQDIDCLNGNSQLIVSEDIDGYDQYFGVQKTDFGRGTLIIRHTDYQNSQSEPIIYTSFLLAKGTTGADTKVLILEEGDYEVVLDYELKDAEITNILNKYGNYSIKLYFSVRNGNCMVYPFDVLTGAELQNTALTENGFYLDLARSRYLDIDVQYSVLVEGAAGVVEDVRYNRPATDGDNYTSEGIYTISVSNRYTGESTTKIIFVGSDELFQEYIDNGFSADRLK